MRLSVLLLSSLLIFSSFEQVQARRSSSSSRSSSSRPKSGSIFKKSTKKATPTTVSKSKTTSRPKSGSTFKSKKNQKPKGTVLKKSSVDQKLAKKMASQKRSFKSKKDAEEAYKKSLDQNKYASRPATRPSHIPESYSQGGTTYQTVFVGGQYGYRMGGAFYPYSYSDYVVDQALLEAAGWWDYQNIHYRNGVASYHSPTVVHSSPTNRNDVVIVLIVFGAIIGIGIVVFMIIQASNKGEI